jgi:putative FmdB family regulatory protein
MATYEYECIECDKTAEVKRSMSEPETVPPCPNCGYKMTRVYSPAGIQFKGSGFYKTDNG